MTELKNVIPNINMLQKACFDKSSLKWARCGPNGLGRRPEWARWFARMGSGLAQMGLVAAHMGSLSFKICSFPNGLVAQSEHSSRI